MKKLIVSMAALASTAVYSQVGVNNTDPKATMDITAKTTDGSKPEGLIVPRLTGDQIRLGNTSYTSAQTGTIIYSTSGDSAPSGKTINITAPGYYYFDGSVWQKVITGSTGDITNDAWVNDNGNTMVKIGTQSDGTTARATGTDMVVKDNGYVGIGTTSPAFPLTVATGSGQYTVAAAIQESTHTSSRRASLGVGYWQVLQDILGNGTRNFSIYNGYPGNQLNALNITETNNVGIGISTPISKLDVQGNAFLRGSAVATGTVNLGIATTSGLERWGIGTKTVETGSGNNGGDFRIWNYADDGSFLGNTVSITRATGNMGVGNETPNARIDARTNTASTSDPGTGSIGLGTTTAAANTAGAGAMRYNTSGGGNIEYSNGSAWNVLTSTVKKSLVYGYLTNGQTLTNGGGTFSVTETFDQNNDFTANTFTVPRTGNYSISLCGLTTVTSWSQGNEFSIRVVKNGTTQVIGYWAAPTTSNYFGGSCTSVTIAATAGDSINLTYYIGVAGKTIHTPDFNRFSIQEL